MPIENASSNRDLDYSKAILLMQMGNIATSMTLLGSIINSFPEDLNAQLGRIVGYFISGNMKEAFSRLDQLIDNQPENHLLYLAKGDFLLRANRQNEAIGIFQKAYALVTEVKLQKQYEFYITFASGDHLGALVKYNELIDIDAATYDVRLAAIQSMLEVNDFVGLRELIDELIVMSPRERGLIMFRGFIRSVQCDYKGAREDILSSLDSFIDRMPEEVKADVYYLIGYCDSQLNDYSQAIRRFTEVILIDDKRGEAFFERGKVKLLNNDPENAIRDFLKSIKFNYSIERCHAYLGGAYLKLFQIEKAIKHFNLLLSLSPTNSDGHSGLGRCSMVKLQYAQARKEFTKSLQNDKTNENTWAQLALLDLMEDQYESALNNARKAEELGENSGYVEVVKGWVANYENQYSVSIRWCEEAIKKNPQLGYAFMCMGFAKLSLNDKSGIQDLKTADILSGGNPVRGMNGALAALADKKYEDAERIITKIIESNKFHPQKKDAIGKQIELMNPALAYFRAHARIEQKKYRQALKDVNVALERDPKQIDTLCLKASIQIGLREYNDAEEVIKVIQEINPQYGPAHLLLGKIEYSNPKHSSDKGLKHFLHAVEIDERLGEAYYYIGKIYSENGAEADAMDAFEKADELGFADAAREITSVDDSQILDPKVMVQEKNADGAKLDYVSIYIEAIKQLKISSPSPRDLEIQTGTAYKKWLSLFQDEVFIMSLKKEIKNKISWAKKEKTKKIWESADRYVDTMVDRACGRILARKSVKIDTNRKIKESQVDVEVDSEDLAELMDEQIKADFGNKTTNYSQDNC